MAKNLSVSSDVGGCDDSGPGYSANQSAGIMGANPHASWVSSSMPNVMGEIGRSASEAVSSSLIRSAPGPPPRADEWLPITPGTDAAFLLAVVHTLFTENLVRLGNAEEIVEGIETLARIAHDWTPERVAPVTGIPAERIRSLGRQLAATQRAAVYGRIGPLQPGVRWSFQLAVDVVNILTGHLDVPGGVMFPRRPRGQ